MMRSDQKPSKVFLKEERGGKKTRQRGGTQKEKENNFISNMCRGYSLIVIMILLTAGSNPARAQPPDETNLAMFSAMNDLSSALARMKESMSGMASAMDDMTSAFARMKRLSGMSDVSGDVNTGTESTDTSVNVVSNMSVSSTPATAESDVQRVTPLTTVYEQPQNYHRVVRVTKRDMGDHYQVTMYYIPSSTQPKVSMYPEPSDIVYGVDQNNTELGKVTVDTPKFSDQDDIRVEFEFPLDAKFVLTLHLTNDTLDEMDVPQVVTSVSPESGDVAFEPGAQPRLELFLWTDDLDGVAVEVTWVSYSILTRTEEDALTMFFPGVPTDGNQYTKLQALDLEEQPHYHHWVFGINSSILDPEGFLRLNPNVAFSCSASSCPVKSLQKILPTMSFRRADHAAAFPENFFGFLFYDFVRDFDSGSKTCYVGEECIMECVVRWADKNKNGSLISVEINEVMPDGDVMATDDVRGAFRMYSTSELMIENVTLADAGRVFRCKARSGLREISKDFELVVVQQARFISELTSVTRFENGSVEATCVAEGVPRPSITIDIYDNWNLKHYDGANVTKLNETTTKATVLVTDNYTTFLCHAAQNPSNGYFENLSISPEEFGVVNVVVQADSD